MSVLFGSITFVGFAISMDLVGFDFVIRHLRISSSTNRFLPSRISYVLYVTHCHFLGLFIDTTSATSQTSTTIRNTPRSYMGQPCHGK